MDRPVMTPAPGSRIVQYVGDRLGFAVARPAGAGPGWRALLRTNLTRGGRVRAETIGLSGAAPTEFRTFAGASWRDIPLAPGAGGWALDLPLTEVGWFRAKAYLLDPDGRQHWPEGSDVGIAVHPDHLRTGNTLYCAFPRLFGPDRAERWTARGGLDEQLRALDRRGYTVIPPSGKLRELTACVPHILDTLGCRILHLLPLGPTPTTFARFGRFGSPYAQLDLAGIDPALVEFDRRTTGVEQFRELAHAVHLRGGLVFLDIVVNHTGWGSRLMEDRPEWFQRDPDGSFHSPGAWGVVWEDLAELDHRRPELWQAVAESLLTWCRRGMDGFRCDAGYMVPLPAWQYIIARVRDEFPGCTFLLEGLGGAWELTEGLLTEGGMQWAYSELFQNYGPREVAGYLDHAIRQGTRMGPLVHYSETHDNDRLAAKDPAWSLLRSRLCALTSQCGAFGFTAGVEWLAAEKIQVHGAQGLAWQSGENLVPELGRLNRLLAGHPCFYDGAALERLSPADSPVLALRRTSRDGLDQCLALVNLDPEPREWSLGAALWADLGEPCLDLLDQPPPAVRVQGDGARVFRLGPWAAHCLAARATPSGLAGDAYRARRAQAAWAYQALAQVLPAEALGPADWEALGSLAATDPAAFLGALAGLDPEAARTDLVAALAAARPGYGPVVQWGLRDLGRVTPLPPGHWLLLRDEAPFAAAVTLPGRPARHLRSIPVRDGHAAALAPAELEAPRPVEAEIRLERFVEAGNPPPGRIRLLAAAPEFQRHGRSGLALLTNGRGGMARLQADLGAIGSKYDCLLGANLHPQAPCDRHVLAKRLRAWVNADGFITALDRDGLVRFEPGPPARWVFALPAGDGRTVPVELTMDLLPGRNTLVARFHRPPGPPPHGADLPPDRAVALTVRLDLEDRGFHGETRADPGLDGHFRGHTGSLEGRPGFRFQPAPDRGLVAWADAGAWHDQPEWSLGLAHPVEASRGMAAQGDAWSPGWFELPLERGATVTLVACADPDEPGPDELRPRRPEPQPTGPGSFEARLRIAAGAFLARRGAGSTVIAGYPWFLDWGRDTFIAARGLLAAGLDGPVAEILRTFARFEDRGTLPNALHGESTADRDTSDAPLWFALAVEEAAAADPALYQADVGGRTLAEVLAAIGAGYRDGTPNGIRMDPGSGLVWSPSHFTWMDTNYPAGTPREGYPVEIQALWLRLLGQLARLRPGAEGWADLAERAGKALDRFWNPALGAYHDLLGAPAGCPAGEARPDGLLRPNQLFLVSLGLVTGDRARKAVLAARRHLLVPGALRSLAPLPAPVPLAILGPGGQPLNDPRNPYWGRYEGDEDSRRKPAYHNGTAWVWLLPTFCEALALAWDGQPEAVAAARAYLGSLDGPLASGCVGHLPEILDGDAPHAQRGCDAQAWSATEALRVWLRLERMAAPAGAG